ncbi:hypothetical protein Nepgr_031147 [Nepenthes gracilis]|uniref:Ubiquitin-like protease family profile domain-containing protein n=1 Tax=Nepenthes gracilis TaxID=150966 RepID=A0AAD3THJ1_NEPGR|nr:hypothetical protein Nepgr_031147 [Nepenthes gracilis]
MGAPTSNRKRADEYFSVSGSISSLTNPKYSNQVDLYVSKKPRISYVPQSPVRVTSSIDAVSRISRYPEPTQPLRREVHAPCRVRKFGFLSSSGREIKNRPSRISEKEEGGDMGNILIKKYEEAKKWAIDSFHYEKEVIDVEPETKENLMSEDSSIEEIEIIEGEHEGGTVISDHRVQETNGLVTHLEKLDTKTVENRIIPASSSAVSDLNKVEDSGKMLDSLSLNRKWPVHDMPLYKKLLESPGIKNSKLSALQFQINFSEKKLLSLFSSRPVKKPEEDVLREPFVPLTKDEEKEVARIFSDSNRRKVLVTHPDSNIQVTVQAFQCLRQGAWLNDEVINLYLELLKERERREPKRFLKCHFFNTFFYKKLTGGRNGYDYKSVRRWTTQKKLGYGLIECDKIFVPIHQEVHWCLAVINKKDEKLQYLDSLKGRDKRVLKVLAKYYVDEVKDKNSQDIDVSFWEHEYVEDLPLQENGSDCGVFMIKYADFYSRGPVLRFSQENMPYFRLRTAKEILRLRAD